MLHTIDEPVATAVLTWLTAEDGGRKAGPPTANVYAATCVFALGGEPEVQPGWPATADEMFSILLEEIAAVGASNQIRYKVGFLAPELARPFVCPGVQLVVLEGPRVVAQGCIEDVFDARSRPDLGQQI